MSVTKCHYEDDDDREVDVDRRGRTSYPTVRFLVETDDDYHSGGSVLLGAQDFGGFRRTSAGGVENVGVPYLGDYYQFYDDVDVSCFVTGFKVKLRDPKDSKRLWTVEVAYGPLERGETQEKQENQNPLDHPPEYWIEWIEDEAPITAALCLTNLPQLNRGPRFERDKFGPVVNAAGQQTVDPLKRKIYYPVLCSQRNIANLGVMINANNNYQDTTNSDPYLGTRPRSWAYLTSTADRPQTAYVDDRGLITYYQMTTKMVYKAATWDKYIVNNGMQALEKDAAGGYKKINGMLELCNIPVPMRSLRRDQDDDSDDDVEETPTSEPVNLRLDGTVADPKEPQTSIGYRYLREVPYSNIGF